MMEDNILKIEIEECTLQLEHISNLLSIFIEFVEHERPQNENGVDYDLMPSSFIKHLLTFNSTIQIAQDEIDNAIDDMHTWLQNTSRKISGGE